MKTDEIMKISRRKSIKSLAFLPLLGLNAREEINVQHENIPDAKIRVPKISLNLYSFNEQLQSGNMSLDEVIDYCALEGYAAIDPTAYYFPGYPDVPSDRFLYDFKWKVFDRGLEISGTGIRNNFSVPDKSKRNDDIQLIKKWTVAASKMGIPVIRIFAGSEVKDPQEKKKTLDWMMEDFKKCEQIGKDHGVIIALQNHGEFIKNSDEVIRIMEEIGSPWFGLHLDIANFGEKNVYKEIERVIEYAVNWQVKEFVMVDGEQVPPDYVEIMKIIRAHGYPGYLPLETLGPGDPKKKLDILKTRFTRALKHVYS